MKSPLAPAHGQDEDKINGESYVNFTAAYYRPGIWVGLLHEHSSITLSLFCCNNKKKSLQCKKRSLLQSVRLSIIYNQIVDKQNVHDGTHRLTPPPPTEKDNEQDEEHDDYDQQQTADHNPHHFPYI